ncbi:MAG: DUF4058 family protein [Caldilineaceae bacterium]
MPSPFPGMDPYLEGEMWVEFQHTFVHKISQQLLPIVRPKYVALLAKRYCTEPFVLDGNDAFGAGLVGLAQPIMDDVPVLSIEIRDVAERRLVTLIEILSPVNKRGEGESEYAQRRLELMQTNTHLLEIDLLCQGRRIQLLQEPPPAPYYIYLSRAQRRPYTQVWALPLQRPLPTIPVPLLPPDPDVPFDLQAAMTDCFTLVGYEDLLDYSAKPPAGLTEEEKTWVVEALQKQGFRRPLNGNV